MIPLFHDFEGETVLVVGGGPVGARKARRFAREADVVVLAPEFAGEDYGDFGNGDFGNGDFGDADLVRAAPDAEAVGDWIDRTDPALVVAATDDDALNETIEDAAREAGTLVNRADVSGARPADSVVVPATVRDGPVTVAVSTGGKSPALSKYLRERIEREVAGADAMAELTAEIRADLRERDVSPADRRAAVRAVVRSRRVRKALDEGHPNPRQVTADVIRDVTGDSS